MSNQTQKMTVTDRRIKRVRSPGQSFMQGTIILSVGVLIVKLLGALYKIPLTNMIGELGMSYFNTAYQLYLPIYTLASAGFPSAVARLVSEYTARGENGTARAVYRSALPFFICSGALGSLLMIFGAKNYATAVGSTGATQSIYLLAPTVLLCCIMSALRGYYNGLRHMTPTAVSQILEAVGRLIFGLCGAYAVLHLSQNEYFSHGTVFGHPVSSAEAALQITLPYAVAAAIFGVTIGAFLGLMYLLLYDLCKTSRTLRSASGSQKISTRKIAAIALPVCAGALIINLGSVMDAILLQTRLSVLSAQTLRQQYLVDMPHDLQDHELPAFLYGCFSMAQNIAALVPTFAQAIGTSALSNVATAAATQKPGALHTAISEVLRLTALLAFPAGFGMSFLARPLLGLLYGARPLGAQIASDSLVLLGVASVFMTFSVPICSMLQAIGRETVTVKLLLIGFAVKFAANYFLIPIACLNMLGACIGTILCYATITIFGLYYLQKYGKCRLQLAVCMGRTLAAAILCVCCACIVYDVMQMYVGTAATVFAVIAAVVSYVFTVLFLRVLQRSDVEAWPFGKKIADLLEKRNWIR